MATLPNPIPRGFLGNEFDKVTKTFGGLIIKIIHAGEVMNAEGGTPWNQLIVHAFAVGYLMGHYNLTTEGFADLVEADTRVGETEMPQSVKDALDKELGRDNLSA